MANKRTNNVLLSGKEEEAEVIFEYDIPVWVINLTYE